MDNNSTAYTVQKAIEEIKKAHEDPNYTDSAVTLHNIQPGCAQRVYELIYNQNILSGKPITFPNKVDNVPSAAFGLAKNKK